MPGGFSLALSYGPAHQPCQQIKRFLIDVAVRDGGLQGTAQEVSIQSLLLEIPGKCADQQEVVGEGIGEGVEHKSVPVPWMFAVLVCRTDGVVQMTPAPASEVLDESDQLSWYSHFACFAA
ncbi:hypothetical protein [Streptomyces canus]|uniref:hypothetical protein n=1 Tax=Streptomyces canus TaxID=58343 RepID=UPI002E305540|nr:hypothetical protein [Streptomyces canus]